MGDKIFPAPAEFTKEQLHLDAILRYFHYEHLPPQLRLISRPFCELAHTLIDSLPRNAERTVALRKLLEAKDAAVRANIGQRPATPDTFETRLVEEYRELAGKFEKLCAFINDGAGFKALPQVQKALLREQRESMGQYMHVLEVRMEDLQIHDIKTTAKRPDLGEIHTIGEETDEPIPFDYKAPEKYLDL